MRSPDHAASTLRVGTPSGSHDLLACAISSDSTAIYRTPSSKSNHASKSTMIAAAQDHVRTFAKPHTKTRGLWFPGTMREMCAAAREDPEAGKQLALFA